MQQTNPELAARLTLSGYPRSASYDAVGVLENLMGPNALWLAEPASFKSAGYGWWRLML